jgi:hypothetical protein
MKQLIFIYELLKFTIISVPLAIIIFTIANLISLIKNKI